MEGDKREKGGEEKSKCTLIDVRMIPCKIMYLLWGGITGTYAPFLNVFFVTIGLSPSQAGLMTGVSRIASSIANPIWGFIADYTGRRRLVIFLMSLGSILFVFPMPWIAKALQNHMANSTHSAHNQTINHKSYSSDYTLDGGNNPLLFPILTIVLTLGAVFVVPLPGFLDSIAVNVVKTGNTKASYGGQRIFGSAGFCIANSLSGLAADHYNSRTMSHYTPVYFIFLSYIILLLPLSFHLIGQENFEISKPKSESETGENYGNEDNHESTGITKHFIIMLKDFDFIFFLITVVISGIAMNTCIYFNLLLVKDEMPTTKAKMSLVLVVGSFANAVMFPFTSKIIKLLRGPTQGLMVAFLAYFIRYTVMSYTTVFEIMISVQVLHALCFALAWSSMIEHLHKVTPKEVVMTVFMMLSSIHFGICGLIANIVGGMVYDAYKGRVLYRSIGIICGVWLIVMVVYHLRKYFSKQVTSDNEVDCVQEKTATVVETNTISNVELGRDELGFENIALEINESPNRDTLDTKK